MFNKAHMLLPTILLTEKNPTFVLELIKNN